MANELFRRKIAACNEQTCKTPISVSPNAALLAALIRTRMAANEDVRDGRCQQDLGL
jgi:hypothetical protein